MTIKFVTVDNVQKIQSQLITVIANFHLHMKIIYVFFILYICCEEKDIMQDYNSFKFFSYDFVSTYYKDDISRV